MHRRQAERIIDMSKGFYQMKREAFGNLPELNVFFNSEAHTQAWQFLLAAIAAQEPFILVTGDYGMGKTLLCMMLERMLRKKGTCPFCYISTTNYSYTRILHEIASSLNIDVQQQDDAYLEGLIDQHFRDLEIQKSHYLIIDDAQELDVSTIGKLRALANFNYDGFFPLRMCFFAHPSFLDKLKLPVLVPLDQRIKRKYHLTPFDFLETNEYIYFRLFKAGAPGIPYFTDEALEEIYRFSDGVPRLINNVCDACLLTGAYQGLTVISQDVVHEAIMSLGGEYRAEYEGAEEAPAGEEQEEEDDQTIVVTFQEPEREDRSRIDQQKVKRELKQAFSFFGSKAFMTVLGFAIFVLVLLFLFNYFVPPGFFDSLKKSFERPKTTIERSEKPRAGLFEEETGEIQNDTGPSDFEAEQQDDMPYLESEINTATQPERRTDLTPPARKQKRAVYGVSRSETAYTLRLATYRLKKDAEKEMSYYQQAGLSPELVRLKPEEGRAVWVIYLGRYRNLDEAQRAKSMYGLSEAMVRKMPYTNRIGDYSSKSALSAMVNRLEDRGYFPYVTKAEGGDFRLFSGAFTTIDEAAGQNISLQNNGLQGKVVHAVQSEATERKIVPYSDGQPTRYPYSLRLACFRSYDDALKEMKKYKQSGLLPYLVKVDLEKRGVWYRIYLGHYRTEAEAERARKANNLSLRVVIKKTDYANLIKTYRSESVMATMVTRLTELEYFPYVIKGAGGELRLYVGSFVTKKGAEDQNFDLLADGIQAQVVER